MIIEIDTIFLMTVGSVLTLGIEEDKCFNVTVKRSWRSKKEAFVNHAVVEVKEEDKEKAKEYVLYGPDRNSVRIIKS